MSFKEAIKKTFSDEKSLVIERYRAAKFAFIMASFIFFVNFYFVWAKFYLDIFSWTLPIMYIILLLSLVFFVYFFLKKLLIWKIPRHLFIVLLIILLGIFSLFVLPSVVKGWLLAMFNV